MSEMKKNLLRQFLKQTAVIAVLYIVFGGLILGNVIDRYNASIIITALIYGIVALGLNLISGMTGQFVLGQAGFMAVGAYTTAILLKNGLPMIPSLLAGAAAACILGFLIGIPALRLRGDYLAIVTLCFGEIIRVIITNAAGLTGGAAGMQGIPGLQGSNDNLFRGFSVAFVVLALAVVFVKNLLHSSVGRAIYSVRDDEVAASAMGINIFHTKLFSLVISSGLAGIGGGLFAMHYRYLNPTMFNFQKSIDFLVIIVFGGMGSITGTLISSIVIVMLQEQLRFLENYRMVIYPLVLVLMMIFRPQGLLGSAEFSIDGVTKKFRSLFGRLQKKSGEEKK